MFYLIPFLSFFFSSKFSIVNLELVLASAIRRYCSLLVWANYSSSFSFDILFRLLEAFQRSRIAPNIGPGTQKYRAATEMMKEIEALERKLFFEQVALNVTENRCDFLDNNYR